MLYNLILRNYFFPHLYDVSISMYAFFLATYIPPEKQHRGFFCGTNWSEEKYPKLKNRQKVTSQRNNIQSEEDYKNYVKSSLSKLSTLESKLKSKGISIKFQPVDVPPL